MTGLSLSLKLRQKLRNTNRGISHLLDRRHVMFSSFVVCLFVGFAVDISHAADAAGPPAANPTDLGGSQITPIRAVATFFNSSTFGFWTGSAQGTINFYQANFPNQQPSIIDIHLSFLPVDYSRTYIVEVLFNGDANMRYCIDGNRYISLYKFELPAEDTFYYTSLKRYDVSVTNEAESVIGRLLRVKCVNCRRRAEAIAGCAVIGRAEDEVYVDPELNRFPTDFLHRRR
uniref:F5/8 type C domain-containing protein n=1 Tax=Panagrellus redivivus TaxID=6233 RepID=A0A7E4UZW6_PANRE